ncbi:MAG: cob(I)yrinic acid a,c-diamide adenosyltransferase [gamma proteobacterium symbiont of Bathyaustriella thionipta]|nr:cob(I)yrinic acid a,c-diamide adenosyltransferase [gamma proteobacterium symbiont of Bathyaustriella thionipta]
MTRIYTRSGDKGQTGLGNGLRVSKSDPDIQLLGSLDELNACIGLVRSHQPPDEYDQQLFLLQQRLFDAGASLAMQQAFVQAEALTQLVEQWIDRISSQLPPLKQFILPGGSTCAAQCHLARTLCRRLERLLVETLETGPSIHALLPFINRLSDYLFVLARAINQYNNCPDVVWQAGEL